MKVRTTISSALTVCASIWSASALAGQPQPIATEQWVTAADNLPDASRLDLEGRVSVDLSVSTTGDVTDCQVVKSSGHSLLDKHTCQLLFERAQFKPATDGNGRPVTGTFSHSIEWQVITNATWAANGMVRAEVVIDPVSGEGTECSAEITGEISDHMKQMACFLLINQARNVPAALPQAREAPYRAVFVLAIYPEATGSSVKLHTKDNGQRIAYSKATVTVSPRGLRTDCRMVETDGPSTLIFPSCGPARQFNYVPGKDAADPNLATDFRQEAAYYVEDL